MHSHADTVSCDEKLHFWKNPPWPLISPSADAPVQAKKAKFQEVQKIKQMLSKVVNKSVEEEMRSRAQEGTRNYSKAQEAVAQHHNSMPNSEPTTDAFVNSKPKKWETVLGDTDIYLNKSIM